MLGMQDAAAAAGILDGFSIKDMRRSRGLAACGGAVLGEAAAFPLHPLQAPHKRCPTPGTGLCKVTILALFTALFHSRLPSSAEAELQPGSPMLSVPFELRTGAGSAPAPPQPPRLPRGGTSSGCRWLPSASGSQPFPPSRAASSLPPSFPPRIFFYGRNEMEK